MDHMIYSTTLLASLLVAAYGFASTPAIVATLKLALQPKRLPWTVSTVLSVLYFVFYFKNILDHEASCDYAPSGFCVTNYVPDVPGEKPHKEGLCPSRFANSHFWAFTVDVLFTIGVLFIGYNPKIFKEQQGRGNAIRLALVIIFHGGLHFLLGYVLQCGVAPSATSKYVMAVTPITETLTFLYAAFIFVLAFVAFRQTSSVNRALSFILSVAFTALIVGASLAATPFNVGTIFGGTQLLLAVIVAFFPKNLANFGTKKQGWFFIAPCAVSLWELLGCCDGSGDKGLFNKIGGHVWYDITLHTALIVTQLTPYTAPTQKD